MTCDHKEVAARPIIGDVGSGHLGSQAFCVRCHATVLHPGSPEQALRYFRRHVRRTKVRR
jgi:hypothetical protein